MSLRSCILTAVRWPPHTQPVSRQITSGRMIKPNVDLNQEMVDMLEAYRSYEANVTAFGAYKDMAVKTLEIGT